MRAFGLFRVGFSKSPHLLFSISYCLTNRVQFKIRKRFCHFLDTGREMILNFHQGGNGVVIGLPALDIFGMNLYSESRLQ